MTRLRLATVLAAVAIILGGFSVSTESVSAEALSCTELQRNYVKAVIRDACSWGGRATVSCDGYSVTVHELVCY